VIGVPECDVFIRGFADVLAVDDLCRYGARRIEGVFNLAIETVGDANLACGVDGRQVGSQPRQLDAVTAFVVELHGSGEFRQRDLQFAFVQPRTRGDELDEFVKSNGWQQRQLGSIGIDGSDSICHDAPPWIERRPRKIPPLIIFPGLSREQPVHKVW
jgi:hypothetical protein